MGSPFRNGRRSPAPDGHLVKNAQLSINCRFIDCFLDASYVLIEPQRQKKVDAPAEPQKPGDGQPNYYEKEKVKKMKQAKKLLAFLLVAVLVISLGSLSAFAEDEVETKGIITINNAFTYRRIII